MIGIPKAVHSCLTGEVTVLPMTEEEELEHIAFCVANDPQKRSEAEIRQMWADLVPQMNAKNRELAAEGKIILQEAAAELKPGEGA